MTPIHSVLLRQFDWIDHGFGTRNNGAWTPQEHTARAHQVHAAGVIEATGPGHWGDGDALITAMPGLWLEIRTADCVPLLFLDARTRVIAAVHAGWRGTAAQIASVTVEAMARNWNSNPSDLRVAIGPCIASCCFAVGTEVADQFPDFVVRTEPQPYVDLVSANFRQLLDAGVPANQIDQLGLCTVCDPHRFHSFRRDRGEGRLVSAIQVGKK